MSTGTLNLGAFAGLGSRNLSRSDERSNNGESRQKRPPAEFWLNVGYPVTLKDETTGEESITFVSLGLGIPLDQIEPFEVRKAGSSNMAALREAQNDLHDAIMVEANKLAPGDSTILFGQQIGDTVMCVQIKRVRGEVEAPAENPLKRTFSFGAPAVEEPKTGKK